MRLRELLYTLPMVLLTVVFLAPSAQAQHKGEPGKFDFYLMNLSWSPEFCSIRGTSPECAARPGFILHGLWTQNNDGTYPVFCTEEPAPANLSQNLDITPASLFCSTSGQSMAPARASVHVDSSPWSIRLSARSKSLRSLNASITRSA